MGSVVTREHWWLTGLWTHEAIVNMLILGTKRERGGGLWKQKVSVGKKIWV